MGHLEGMPPSRLADGTANPAYFKEWADRNRERVRAASRAYYHRTKSRGVAGHEYREMAVNLLVERDGTTCAICGIAVDPADGQIDHIVQRAVGGTHAASNLRLVHATCNRSRPKPRSHNGE